MLSGRRHILIINTKMDDAKTVWCGNISDKVTEELLFELFLQAAPLEKVRIPLDKEGRKFNFAFITFKHEESVEYALHLLNGIRLYDKSLNVKPKNSNANRSQQNQILTRITDNRDQFQNRPTDNRDQFQNRLNDNRDQFQNRSHDNRDQFQNRSHDNRDQFQNRSHDNRDRLNLRSFREDRHRDSPYRHDERDKHDSNRRKHNNYDDRRNNFNDRGNNRRNNREDYRRDEQCDQ